MKPQYANTFGIRKVSDKEGEVLEVTHGRSPPCLPTPSP